MMTMLTMPDNVNFLEAIVLPNEQFYVGRGQGDYMRIVCARSGPTETISTGLPTSFFTSLTYC